MHDLVNFSGKKVLLGSVAWAITIFSVAVRVDAVTLASAQLGAVGLNGGDGITTSQTILGWRFEVNEPFQVQQIGGHMLGFPTQGLPPFKDIFGAIIPLASVTSMPAQGPAGTPFDPASVMASTTFKPPGSNTAPFAAQSEDILVPLDATLAPGAYALMFGTDMFGATGNAAMPGGFDQPLIAPTTGESFIKWQQQTGAPAFQWHTFASTAHHLRFVIEGLSLAPLVGDLDGDGFVGITDLNLILGVWNQNVPPGNPLADPSGDGFVGISDLNIVLGNWNAASPPSAVAPASIPAPSSLALLSSSGLVITCRRRRSADLSDGGVIDLRLLGGKRDRQRFC